uniref:NeuD/PglB/VioB family sugar acetyltransferase n=1 Tax=Helicobacter cinaedi TaxID=213 RepID=UPI000D7CFDFD
MNILKYLSQSRKLAPNLIIWGGTGHAKVLAQIIHQEKIGRICHIFDINPNVQTPIAYAPISHSLESYNTIIQKYKNLLGIVAIGGAKGADRLKLLDMFQRDSITTPNIIHSSATILSSITTNYGIHIFANSMVGVDVKLGHGVIINSSATIEHECKISDGVHIAPGATLCGCVEIGKQSFVGANATILPRIKIGQNVIIGAGAVVTKNISDNTIAFGNPAKIITGGGG